MPVYKIRVINKAVYPMTIRAESKEEAKTIAMGMEDRICAEEYLYDVEVCGELNDNEEADND